MGLITMALLLLILLRRTYSRTVSLMVAPLISELGRHDLECTRIILISYGMRTLMLWVIVMWIVSTTGRASLRSASIAHVTIQSLPPSTCVFALLVAMEHYDVFLCLHMRLEGVLLFQQIQSVESLITRAKFVIKSSSLSLLHTLSQCTSQTISLDTAVPDNVKAPIVSSVRGDCDIQRRHFVLGPHPPTDWRQDPMPRLSNPTFVRFGPGQLLDQGKTRTKSVRYGKLFRCSSEPCTVQ